MRCYNLQLLISPFVSHHLFFSLFPFLFYYFHNLHLSPPSSLISTITFTFLFLTLSSLTTATIFAPFSHSCTWICFNIFAPTPPTTFFVKRLNYLHITPHIWLILAFIPSHNLGLTSPFRRMGLKPTMDFPIGLIPHCPRLPSHVSWLNQKFVYFKDLTH